MAHPHHQPLERDGDGGAPQQGIERIRRPYRVLRLLGRHVRRRPEPLLARAPPSMAVTWCSSRAMSCPGLCAIAHGVGRITEEQLLNFRSEVGGNGLSSYPHPWLLPDYWQFPTVSMGLGPLMAIYQARFMKYMHNRGLIDMADRKVWCFLGDGEMDEPESRGAIDLAARENSTT